MPTTALLLVLAYRTGLGKWDNGTRERRDGRSQQLQQATRSAHKPPTRLEAFSEVAKLSS